MRDDTQSWDAPPTDPITLTGDGVTVTQITGLCQTLVSGPSALTHFGPAIGWPDPVNSDRYAVALRRDRALLINSPDLTDGWDGTARLAISDMTGAFDILEFTGPAAIDLLRRGTDLALDAPSRSAARLFAGFEVILYRNGDAETFRLHVQRGHSQALAVLLGRFLESLPS